MKREFTIIIHYGMTCVSAALKTDHDVRFLSHHIGDLALAFVAPVSAHNCSYHFNVPFLSEFVSGYRRYKAYRHTL